MSYLATTEGNRSHLELENGIGFVVYEFFKESSLRFTVAKETIG